MIKLVCLINRPESQSAESFRQWWLGHHSRVAAQLPGLLRYTISTAIPEDDGEPRYDGVAELWFESREAMEAAFSSEEGARCSHEDRAFIGRRLAFLTEEHVILGPEARSASPDGVAAQEVPTRP